ncbi:MAG: class II aldolase/adducin family protein [Chloroflexi bacterium]|nr:class II aldolase/adducin family protein [Chloroflexota bacterium]
MSEQMHGVESIPLLLGSLRVRVLAAAQEAARIGLMSMTSGNFSARDATTGHVVITPSGRSYATMRPDDIVVVALDGTIIDGTLKPSSETPLHLGVYEARPDVSGIAHVHSVHANAVGTLRLTVPPIVGTLWKYVGGALETAPFMESGSREYAEHALRVMGDRRATIMANHGLLAVSETVEQALETATYAEEGARVFLLACALGEPAEHPKPSVGMMYAPSWWR